LTLRSFLFRHHGQHQRRGMLRIMKNGVLRGHEPVCVLDLFPGVQIAIESRKVAARDFQAQRMPAPKHIAGRPEVDRNLVGFARIHQHRVLRESRYRMRRIPSATSIAKPSGATSTSLPVKSVSTAVDFTNRVKLIGPVTSRSSDKGPVE